MSLFSRRIAHRRPASPQGPTTFPAALLGGHCKPAAAGSVDEDGLSVGTDGVAHPLWTDMRRVVTVSGATGTTENIFSAAVP
jgi:hypothetical protein